MEYLYDGLGRRIGKKVGGTMVAQWLYGAALGPVAQLDDAGNLQMRFVYGTKRHVPDYMVILSGPNAGTYRLLTDQLGSVRLVVNADPNAINPIAQKLEYDAWGNVLKDTSPGFQPFGFAGGVVDQDTGFVHFGARDYDPGTGRWMRKDPEQFNGGDTNLYAYVLNDPINRTDPKGLWGAGVEIDFSAIAPFFSNGGGVVGINLQYTSDQGWALFAVTPTASESYGFDIGPSLNFNFATGNGPWSGTFDNYFLDPGKSSLSYFESPDGQGYKGITLGVGRGLTLLPQHFWPGVVISANGGHGLPTRLRRGTAARPLFRWDRRDPPPSRPS